jgi:hypothetical protein
MSVTYACAFLTRFRNGTAPLLVHAVKMKDEGLAEVAHAERKVEL